MRFSRGTTSFHAFKSGTLLAVKLNEILSIIIKISVSCLVISLEFWIFIHGYVFKQIPLVGCCLCDFNCDCMLAESFLVHVVGFDRFLRVRLLYDLEVVPEQVLKPVLNAAS